MLGRGVVGAEVAAGTGGEVYKYDDTNVHIASCSALGETIRFSYVYRSKLDVRART